MIEEERGSELVVGGLEDWSEGLIGGFVSCEIGYRAGISNVRGSSSHNFYG